MTAHDLAHWDTSSSAWVATAGTYQVLVGDSSRSLPLSAPVTVAATVTANVAGLGVGGGAAAAVNVTNPFGMSSRTGVAASLQIQGDAGLTYTATGLPAGLSISPAGQITGTGTARGTSTVTVTGTSASGARASVTFVWTVS